MNNALQELLPPNPLAAHFDIDDPTEIWHEQTKFHRATFFGHIKNITRFLHHPAYIARGIAGYTRYNACPRLDLPAPRTDIGSLAAAMHGRTSIREFTGTLDLTELSTLLHHALRVNRTLASTVAPHLCMGLRPYPSPGGLYPTEFYLFLNCIQGVTPCIAHYDPREHCCRILKNQDNAGFSSVEIAPGTTGIAAPLIITLVGVPQRTTAKYGCRGYRMALLEAGHASQNLCLAAQGSGLASLIYGAYYDDELADLLMLDGVTETVVSVILIGKPAQTAPTTPSAPPLTPSSTHTPKATDASQADSEPT